MKNITTSAVNDKLLADVLFAKHSNVYKKAAKSGTQSADGVQISNNSVGTSDIVTNILAQVNTSISLLLAAITSSSNYSIIVNNFNVGAGLAVTVALGQDQQFISLDFINTSSVDGNSHYDKNVTTIVPFNLQQIISDNKYPFGYTGYGKVDERECYIYAVDVGISGQIVIGLSLDWYKLTKSNVIVFDGTDDALMSDPTSVYVTANIIPGKYCTTLLGKIKLGVVDSINNPGKFLIVGANAQFLNRYAVTDMSPWYNMGEFESSGPNTTIASISTSSIPVNITYTYSNIMLRRNGTNIDVTFAADINSVVNRGDTSVYLFKIPGSYKVKSQFITASDLSDQLFQLDKTIVLTKLLTCDGIISSDNIVKFMSAHAYDDNYVAFTVPNGQSLEIFSAISNISFDPLFPSVFNVSLSIPIEGFDN